MLRPAERACALYAGSARVADVLAVVVTTAALALFDAPARGRACALHAGYARVADVLAVVVTTAALALFDAPAR